MNVDYQIGAFRGRKLIQRHGEIGGSKSVFVKLQGIKNHLVYPTFGGVIKNPFKGTAKMYAGDLCEFRLDATGRHGEVYLLKTFEVVSVENGDTTVNILRNQYRHIPFVGDKLGVAPDTVGGEIATNAVVTSVVPTSVTVGASKVEVWAVTFASALTGASQGNILVEVDEDNKMLVKDANAVIDCDLDMLDAPSTGDEDFDGARYVYTPSLGGLMYIDRMSPTPKCILDKNKTTMNGWFLVQTV